MRPFARMVVGLTAQFALDEARVDSNGSNAARAAWMMAGRDERYDFRAGAPMMAVVEGSGLLNRCLVLASPKAAWMMRSRGEAG